MPGFSGIVSGSPSSLIYLVAGPFTGTCQYRAELHVGSLAKGYRLCHHGI